MKRKGKRLKSAIPCPVCRTKNDAATCVVGEKNAVPHDGAIGVCLNCGGITIYENNVTSQRLASPEEIKSWPEDIQRKVTAAARAADKFGELKLRGVKRK